MVISGSGSLPGGDYMEEVRISGSGKVNGSISCTELSISGSGKVCGDLRSEGKASISGSGSVEGDAQVKEFAVSGSGHVHGELKGEKCSVAGSFHVGSVSVQELSSSGSIHVCGDLSAEQAVIRGAIYADGLINAENLDVAFESDSRADSIGGSTVKIRKKGVVHGLLDRIFKAGKEGTFQVKGSIEADEIDIEYVEADTVVGRNVVIGPGCKIKHLSYSESIKISPEAEVSESSRGKM